MEKGFYEAGLMVKNIIRARYRKLMYIGVGFAGFYRYGQLAYTDALDNAAFKFSLLFSL